MNALILTIALACPCDDFAADVARRADLMAADVETMPHVVKEGLRRLAYDARSGMRRLSAETVRRMNAREKLRAELEEVVQRNRAAFLLDWPEIEQAIREAAKVTR
jgi:hypothetical protein